MHGARNHKVGRLRRFPGPLKKEEKICISMKCFGPLENVEPSNKLYVAKFDHFEYKNSNIAIVSLKNTPKYKILRYLFNHFKLWFFERPIEVI